jgi:hypothetical protein
MLLCPAESARCCVCVAARSGYGGAARGGFAPFAARGSPHAHGGFGAPQHLRGLTVKMRGLPFRVSPQEVFAFFAGFALVPDTLQMGSDSLGRPSGEGWLAFSSCEEAERAARERNRQYIGSRYVELTVV